MYPSSSASKNIFTVTQLNRLARSVLESEIGQIWLSAEISNFVAASSGHWYFTLKDNRAQVKAAMFRGANTRVNMKPKEGDKILVRASVGVYEARGDYQLVVDFMEPEGQGQLKQQFERLKLALAAEGLFATSHKKPIPERVSKVGIITSATGAALHDILTVLQRRNPSISVIVYPSQVQGDAAPAQICQAIESADRRNEVDVLIIGRGGGSLEDLWCFNDERVARAIFACKLPTISAVGHEVDITIADFVSDVRAPTPSAAAELVSSDQLEIVQQLLQRQKQLVRGVMEHITRRHHQSQMITQRLKQTHPENQIRQQQQYLDTLRNQLHNTMTRRLTTVQNQANSISQRLRSTRPDKRVNQELQKSALLSQRLTRSMSYLLNQNRFRLAKASELLDSVSPLATLSRGYSITFADQKIIKSAKSLEPGDKIRTQFHDGEIESTVLGSEK